MKGLFHWYELYLQNLIKHGYDSESAVIYEVAEGTAD